MPKQLDFTIGPDGSVSLEASGFQGKECDLAAEVFIRALGADVVSKAYKADVKAKAARQQRLEQKSG